MHPRRRGEVECSIDLVVVNLYLEIAVNSCQHCVMPVGASIVSDVSQVSSGISSCCGPTPFDRLGGIAKGGH